MIIILNWRTKKKTVLVVLISTTFIEMITLLSITGYRQFLKSDIMAPEESNMCLSMRKFLTIPREKAERHCPDGLQEKVNTTEETRLCCGPISVILDKTSSMKVRDKYDGNAFPEMEVLYITPSECLEKMTEPLKANLVGLSDDLQPDQTNASPGLFWNSMHPSSYCSKLRYISDTGTINITTSGHYYISSQIKIKGIASGTIKHGINRIKNGGKEQILLQGEKSFCKLASDAAECSSFIGSVFKLESGDQLYISTSDPDRVVFKSKDNYFSVYSL